MKLREFTLIGVGAMILFQLITSFAAIRLLTRMSPAIEQILQENEASIEAAETMLASLASAEQSADAARLFKDALRRAKNNVTEDEEVPVLKTIERHMPGAFHGDHTARGVLFEEILKLSAINRLSMRRADDEAKRIGSAGAWTMALLGVMGVFFWGVVLRRIFRTLVRPLDEIQRVFEAQTNGEYRRRVLLGNIGSEMNELAGLINRMLDARLDISNREQREGERAALLHLLDTIPSPAGIVTPGGVLAASNRAMESMLNESGPDQHGLPDFRAIPDALSSEWSIQTVNSPGWMIVQKIPSTPSASQLQLTPVSPSP